MYVFWRYMKRLSSGWSILIVHFLYFLVVFKGIRATSMVSQLTLMVFLFFVFLHSFLSSILYALPYVMLPWCFFLNIAPVGDWSRQHCGLAVHPVPSTRLAAAARVLLQPGCLFPQAGATRESSDGRGQLHCDGTGGVCERALPPRLSLACDGQICWRASQPRESSAPRRPKEEGNQFVPSPLALPQHSIVCALILFLTWTLNFVHQPFHYGSLDSFGACIYSLKILLCRLNLYRRQWNRSSRRSCSRNVSFRRKCGSAWNARLPFARPR